MAAAAEGRPCVARQARACRSVVDYIALGVGSTRRRVTKLLGVHEAAVAEGVTLVSRGAATDGDMVADVAVGVDPAGAGADVHATVVATRLAGRAVRVVLALAPLAVGERVAPVAGQAGTDRSSTGHVALGVLAAGVGGAGVAVVGHLVLALSETKGNC